ncbi:uncharacterized protein LOC141710238 [Apium graveolens]|uniref:uncharacterized protein LOC141710238 n=1 Tax=Apium graveolens TaxID=4045 RepID=UPI003D7AFD5F
MAKSEATPVVPSSELLEWPRKDKHGFLNVVSRVGDLVRTIKFYTQSFGMKLLRKRDIPEEKNANAFLGFGPKESQFVVDLTYNMFKPYIVTWTLTIPVGNGKWRQNRCYVAPHWWNTFLIITLLFGRKSRVQCVQLDGSMTMKARDATVTRFIEDPDCELGSRRGCT